MKNYKWVVKTDESNSGKNLNFIIVHQNEDGSRLVITKQGKIVFTKQGKIVEVGKDETIHSKCGPLVIVKNKELEKYE